MKNFRSSKNLRAVDPSSKEESALRLKVKCLEEQIELLQKSNLNIFIPLSEHEAKSSPNL
jgi:chromosome segregation ATPase